MNGIILQGRNEEKDPGVLRRGPKGALVTGLRMDGTGEALARKLATSGYRVIAAERNAESARKVVENFAREGIEIRWVEADLCNEEDVRRVGDAVAEHLGSLDLVVNNAGDARKAIGDCTENLRASDLIEFFRNNLISAFLVTMEMIRRFLLPMRTGVVVFITSCNSAPGYARWGQLGYSISKAGLEPLHRDLTAAYARSGLRFYLIRPSILLTGSPNWKERLRKQPRWPLLEGTMIPCGHLPRPEDVAEVVAFLATPAAAFLNGNEIRIDGGLLNVGPGNPFINPRDPRGSYVEGIERLAESMDLDLEGMETGQSPSVSVR